ncbi:MAG: VWA domain-containing protein [Syntrophobacteraceae bacterium]
MRFEFPWAFLIVPLLLLIMGLNLRRRPGVGLKFSSIRTAAASGASARTRLRHLPLVVRGLAVVLLTVGLARPQQGREEVRDVSKGIAIEMVVDRSGSMGQELNYEGTQLNRLEVVKKIFREFVLGNGKDLPGRPSDLIGMVTFARYADTICPLTLSHGALDRFIESIRLVTRKNEDGTAIGDGLALAAARLKTAEETLKSPRGQAPPHGSPESPQIDPLVSLNRQTNKDYQIKSKIVILLTDGQNNAGKRSPIEAARLAKEWGIRVYAIGIGGRESFMTIKTPLGDYKVPGGPGVDEATLKGIADETGGAFWLAESSEKLLEIYKEIDKLERADIESVRHIDYAERFAPFLLAALALLTLEAVLASTVFRRVP